MDAFRVFAPKLENIMRGFFFFANAKLNAILYLNFFSGWKIAEVLQKLEF